MTIMVTHTIVSMPHQAAIHDHSVLMAFENAVEHHAKIEPNKQANIRLMGYNTFI